MKDQTLRVEYYAITADDKPGMGADLGKKLAKESVNLLALLAFPTAPGRVQVDIVPEHPEQFTKAARKLGLSLGPPKTAFLTQGTDRAGALGEMLDRLGTQGINVRATCGVACGGNRYGAIVWVAPADVDMAARVLGAQSGTHKV
jgi:hypothetical protein